MRRIQFTGILNSTFWGKLEPAEKDFRRIFKYMKNFEEQHFVIPKQEGVERRLALWKMWFRFDLRRTSWQSNQLKKKKMVASSLRFLNTDMSFLCYEISIVTPEDQNTGLYLSIVFSCTKDRLGPGIGDTGQDLEELTDSCLVLSIYLVNKYRYGDVCK